MTWRDPILILLFAAHLAALNVATAGPIVCIWLGWRSGKRRDAAAAAAGPWLVRQSLVGLTAGIVLGGGLLCAVWYHRPEPFFKAAQMIPVSRYWWGIAELAFSYVLLVVYLAGWRRYAGRWWHTGIVLLAATNLAYHFPPLFAAIGTLSSRPLLLDGHVLGRSQLMELLRDAETLARSLHFLLASFAVTGAALLGLAQRLAKGDASRGDAERITVWAGWLGLVPTCAQLIVGLWLLLASPAPVQSAFSGGDGWATGLFVVSLVAVLAMLSPLASAAFGTAGSRERRRAILLMAIALMGMAAARHVAHERLYDGYSNSGPELIG